MAGDEIKTEVGLPFAIDSGAKPHSKPSFPSPWTLTQSHTPGLVFRHHGLWHKTTLEAWFSNQHGLWLKANTPSLAFPSPWTLAQKSHSKPGFPSLWTLAPVTLQAWLSVTMNSGTKPHSKPGFPSPWTLAQSHTPRLAFRHHGLWHKVTLQTWLSVHHGLWHKVTLHASLFEVTFSPNSVIIGYATEGALPYIHASVCRRCQRSPKRFMYRLRLTSYNLVFCAQSFHYGTIG